MLLDLKKTLQLLIFTANEMNYQQTYIYTYKIYTKKSKQAILKISGKYTTEKNSKIANFFFILQEQ